MKPAAVQREVTAGGVLNSAKFGIDVKSQAFLLNIVRDKIYTDKILAVLREYSANAWDAHREVGKDNVPIQVTLPTDLDPALVIRDEGPGLSENDIYEVYVKYAASTKRTTNAAVGMLGIGAKSAFAYSDQFTITSWWGGMKKVYVCLLDETDVGVINKLHEEECPDEETGIEITVPVDPKDISAFRERAATLFPFFDPQPEINLPLEVPVDESDRTEFGWIRRAARWESGHWVAVMGCIPYKVNMQQVRAALEERGLFEAASQYTGGMFFNIGDVDISASREELEYTDRTKVAIIHKLEALVEGIIQEAYEVSAKAQNNWQRRLDIRAWNARTALPLPEDLRVFNHSHVSLWDEPLSEPSFINRIGPLTQWESKELERYLTEKEKRRAEPLTFTMGVPFLEGKSMNVSRRRDVNLSPNSKFVIRDTPKSKSLRGYIGNNQGWIVITPKEHVKHNFLGDETSRWTPTADEVEAELLGILEANKLDGMSITRTSVIGYTPYSKSSNQKNSKHKHRTFVLGATVSSVTRASDNWEVAPDVPEEDAPYVRISQFLPCTLYWGGFYGVYNNFWESIRTDRKVFKEFFEEDFPTVYGIKTTEKMPVSDADIDCVPYHEWMAEAFTARVQHPKVQQLLEVHDWKSRLGGGLTTLEALYANLHKEFDGRHRLLRFVNRVIKTKAFWKGLPEEQREAFERFYRRYAHYRQFVRDARATKRTTYRKVVEVSVAQDHLQEIYTRYPLLDPKFNSSGLGVLFHEDRRAHWIHYIKLMDAQKQE